MTIYNNYYAVANKFPVSNFGPISKLNITPIKVSLKECCVYVAADCGSRSCQSAEGTFHTSPEWNPPPISNIIHTDKIILKRKVRFCQQPKLKDPGALSTLSFLSWSNWRWELLELGQQRQQVSNLSEEEKIGRRAAGKAYKELPFFTFEPVLVETLNCMVCPLSGQMWNESDKFWTCLKRKRKEEQKDVAPWWYSEIGLDGFGSPGAVRYRTKYGAKNTA